MARVLLVDDNADLRTAWRALLEVSGHQVVEAGHGRAAMDHLHGPAANVDVVLLDLLMPEMDGRTFLTELQKRPGKKPPVVVTSEFLGLVDTPAVVAKLKKPVAKDDLLAAVRTAVAPVEDTEDVAPVKGHVLVADDDEATRELLRRWLRSKRFQVTTVADGNAALEVLEQRPVDVVLLDLMMPGASGREVLRRMRETPALARTPVVVASATADPEDVAAALELGADDYVTKPFDLNLLAARLDGRLKRRASSVPNARALSRGTILDEKYLLGERIGGGGFGTVFSGTHLGLQSPIAVKVLSSPAMSRQESDALRAEGVAACRVVHPNAVRVFDFGVLGGGVAYLVMELLQGRTLLAEMAQAPLPLARVAQLLVPVCNCLHVAHEASIVHRDVKPANIVLHQGPTGEIVKVVDFGIAKLTGGDGRAREEDGSAPGTLQYMAPEALRGEPLDGKADVFSVGVVLYETLTASRPFGAVGKDAWAYAERVQRDAPAPPSSRNPKLSRRVDDVVLGALAKDPEHRPTARALAHALRTALVDA